MKNEDFERMLEHSLKDFPGGPPGGGLEAAVLLAGRAAAGRVRRISFLGFLKKQVRYIGLPLWLTQGLALLLFERLLAWLYGEEYWSSPASVARLLLCASVLVAMMALPLLCRSIRYRMQEVEGASYFSSVRLMAAKLAVIGLGDGLLLAGMFLTALVRTSMQTGSLLICLLLPFLILCAAYLYMLGHCGGAGLLAGGTGLGAAMLLLAQGLPGRWLPMFRQPLGWAAVLGLLLAFCAGQCRYLLRHSAYGELQIT